MLPSDPPTWDERRYPVELLTGILVVKPDRLGERAARWGDHYLSHTREVVERWAIRAVTRRDAVRTGPVTVRDVSDMPALFILDLLAIGWRVKAVRGPIPGMTPGQFIPIADHVTELRVAVFEGAEGWAQSYVEPEPTVELDLALARRVAKRAHSAHGDWRGLGRCVEPDCIAMRELLA